MTATGRSVRILQALACTLFLFGAGLRAQTVQPAVVEISSGKQATVDGHFEVINNTLEPMIVTIEAKSFDIGRDGVAAFRPLSPEVHLEMSATSLRLWPKQHRTVFYQASAPRFPTWFCIYSNFSSAVHRTGVQVQMEMPHTVYLLDRTKAGSDQVHFTSLRRVGDTLHGVVQNGSGTLVRVTGLELSGASGKVEAGGFPILPGAEREFTLAMAPGPAHVRARTAGFHIDGEVQ
jgi:hypothetical protein